MNRYETDEEQLTALKNWWDKYGTALLSAVLVVVLAWVGWSYYQKSQFAKASNASTTFEVLQSKVEQNAFGDVAREGLKLMEDQPKSPYATATALMEAQFELEKGHIDKAIENLQWVINQNIDASLVLVAKLRMTGIYIDQKQYDKATAVLKSVDAAKLAAGEKANFDFTSGFLALQQNQLDVARQFLQQVVDNTAAAANLQNVARLQLGDLTQ
jgi:predicted negative regulator of RcsB-dependent stress response